MKEALEFFTRDTLRNTRLRLIELLESGKCDFQDERTFTAIISTVLDCCGVNPKEISELLPIHLTSVWRWRTGKKVPELDSRTRIINAVKNHLKTLVA